METVCKVCGKPVGKGRRNFCSDKCRKKFYSDQLRSTQNMKCLFCGRPLPKNYKKYCSLTCRSEAAIRKNELDEKEELQFLALLKEGKVAHGLDTSQKLRAVKYAKHYGNSKLNNTLNFIDRINMPYNTYRYWRDILHRTDEEIESLWNSEE